MKILNDTPTHPMTIDPQALVENAYNMYYRLAALVEEYDALPEAMRNRMVTEINKTRDILAVIECDKKNFCIGSAVA